MQAAIHWILVTHCNDKDYRHNLNTEQLNIQKQKEDICLSAIPITKIGYFKVFQCHFGVVNECYSTVTVVFFDQRFPNASRNKLFQCFCEKG